MHARIRELAASAKPTGTALQADATITRNAGGTLQLELVIRAGDLVGVRTLAGRSCDDLAGAVAVNLALLLAAKEPLTAADVGARPETRARTGSKASRPRATTAAETASKPEPQPPEQPPTREPPPRSEEPQPEQPIEEEGAPSTRAWRGLLDVPLGALELGPLAEPSFGGALAAGLWLDRWRILAEGNLWLRQKLSAMTPLMAGAEVDRLTGTLRVCRTFPLDRFELAPCVHVSLHHVSARGTGTHIAARTEVAMWVASGLGVQARLRLTPWLGLLGSVDAAIEGARPRIVIDGVGLVGQLGPAAVRMAFGLEWIL